MHNRHMPACELAIVVEGDGRAHPRETISGRVVVQVAEATNVEALTIQTVLVSRISKTTTTIPGTSATLFNGSLSPGEHVYPFSLPAPSLPFEYMGEDASLFWRLSAHADVPWATDVEATEEIQLRPRDGTRWKLQRKATGDPQAVHDTRSMVQETSTCGCVVLGIAGLVAAIALLSLALAFEPEEKTALIVLSVIAFILGVVSLVLSRWRGTPEDLSREANQKIAAQRIGAPQLAVELEKPGGYREGFVEEDVLACSLWVKPDAPPLQIHATLEAEVSWLVMVEGGARSKTERRSLTLHSATSPLTASGPGQYRGRIVLPTPGAVPSPIELPNGAVAWRLRSVVRCTELGWSNTVELPISVRPEPGPGFDQGVVA